jgi:hypothetical protein
MIDGWRIFREFGLTPSRPGQESFLEAATIVTNAAA